jgi:hypothetical protein
VVCFRHTLHNCKYLAKEDYYATTAAAATTTTTTTIFSL